MKHPMLAAAILLFAAAGAAAQAVPGGFTVGNFGTGISNGTAMAWSPDGRLFVCEQGGAIRVIKNGTLLGPAFHTVAVHNTGERGLLGIAFDPDFNANGFVYVYYTTPLPAPHHNRISRLRANPPTSDTSDASETMLVDLENLSTATNHNGGAIHFGPDGKLYAAVGENANAALAMSLTSRFGKILRYNPDGTIPNDNPSTFPGIGGSTTGVNRAIWAVGLRNPFTFAFQPGTGRMFINDVGEVTWEEINDGIAGRNYGWQGGATDGARNLANFTDPIYAYQHGAGTPQGNVIAGGAFYNPIVVQFPASYVGKYFFADAGASWIYYIDPASPGAATQFLTGGGSPVDLQIGPDGALYYLNRGGGAGVHRVSFTGVVTHNLIVSTTQVSVTEGSTAVFNVRLAVDPGGPLAVTVANTLGSASVTATPTINFTGGGGNWNTNQPVTVTAAADADAFDSSALLTLTATGVTPRSVVVTVTDTNAVANHPVARIVIPVHGDTVGGAATEFYGNGTPAAGAAVTKADFYIDGILMSTDTNSTGHYHIGGAGHNGWNTTGLSNGSHVLRMTVTDNNGTPRVGSHEITVFVLNGSGGGGGDGGGGCGGTGLEALAAIGLAVLLNRLRRR